MRIINPFTFDNLKCGDLVWSADYKYGEINSVECSTGRRVVKFHNGEKKGYHCRGRFGREIGNEESLIWPALPFKEGGYVLRDNGDAYRVRSVTGDKDSLYPIFVFPISGGTSNDTSVTPSGHFIVDECNKGSFWPIEGGCYPKFCVGMPVMQIDTKEVGEVFCVVDHRQTLAPVGVRWGSGRKDYFTMDGQRTINGSRVIFPLEHPNGIPQPSGINGMQPKYMSGSSVFLKEEVREYLRIGEAVPVPTRRTIMDAGVGLGDMYRVTGCSTLRSEDSLIPEDQIETVLDIAIELYVVAQRRCLEEYKKNILEGSKGE